MTQKFTVAGIMSGTSLDGLDIAVCSFEFVAGRWTFQLQAAETFSYNDEWKTRLSDAFSGSGADIAKLHFDFGKYIASCANSLFQEENVKPQLISSHGHTIFHQPSAGYTFQIGSGAVIASLTGIDTVCDFRSIDVALGGQGAPLVPIGDHYLFGGHKFCLNLGGIANISFEKDHERIAFDICPANMPLNLLAMKEGKSFDENGEIAISGNVQHDLLTKLNSLSFYSANYPKSLGREWYEKEFMPVIESDNSATNDKLRTVVEHIGIQISNVLFHSPGTTMLTTGGGAFNDILIDVIEEHVSRHGIHVVVPDENIIGFKEAIIFAFIGLLRTKNEHNTLASVTGAKVDTIGGCIYKGDH